MKFKKLGALILGALLTIGVAAGIGATVEKDRALAEDKVPETLTITGTTGTLGNGNSLISWSGENVTFTNKKGGTAIRTSDSDHYRIYAGSEILIEAKNEFKISKIVFTTTSSSYATVLTTSLTNGGYSATPSDSVVTATFATLITSLTAIASAQIRINKIEVTYDNNSTGGESGDEPVTPVEQTITASAEIVEVGSSIELKTNADTATWSITTGEGFATLLSKEGQIVSLVGEKEGSVTVKAVADGYIDAEITITIEAASSGEEPGDVTIAEDPCATFTFGDNGEPGHKDGSNVTTNYTETSGNHTFIFNEVSKVYFKAFDAKGNSCLKLGTSSAAASFTFTVPDDILLVKIYIAGYKTNKAIISINGETQEISTLSDNGEYTTVEVDVTNNKTITLETVSGGYRAMINTIEYYAEAVDAELTPFEITEIIQQPDAIYVGDTLDVKDFKINVLYDDEVTYGTVTPDKIEADTSKPGTVTATVTYSNLEFEFEIEVLENTIASFSWDNNIEIKGFVGDNFSEVAQTSKWVFTVMFANGEKINPTFGIGEDDVHIALYETNSTEPETEGEPLSNEYVFTEADINKKSMRAYYKGEFRSTAVGVTICSKLNEISFSTNQAKIISEELGLENATSFDEPVNTDYNVQLTGNIGTHANSKPTYYTSDRTIRIYAGNTFTISSSKTISSIEFVNVTGYTGGEITADNGTYNKDTYIWIGETLSVTFTAGDAWRILQIKITFVENFIIDLANKDASAQKKVIEYATYFNEQMEPACNSGSGTEQFNTAWANVAGKYSELFGGETSEAKEYAKNMLKYATATWKNPDCLQRAMKTYDFVVAQYGYDAFMDEIRPVSQTSGLGLYHNGDDATLIIILVSIVALTGFAFFYVTKRNKKEIEL